jgi:hypothetical protein
MATNNRIRVSELEFDSIKENLKDFLRGQAQFSDYDFEGSNLSILIDLLAYNTHYNALYTNFALNEVFLDSASKRNSVVSLARSIGYRPRSAVCATTKINFTVTGTNSTPSFLTLPAKLVFYGIKDGVRYNFYTDDDITAAYNSTTQSYTFSQIPLKEGVPLRNTFTYSSQNKYVIPNANVDSTTIKVSVTTSQTNNTTVIYKAAEDLSLVTEFSTVYFLKEIDDGYLQLEFGDGILGKALSPGNIITVDYQVSNGTLPNRITTLSYGGSTILGSAAVSVTVLVPAYNGRGPESIDEVRFNAPNFYAAQNRAVTIDDYKVLLRRVASIGDVIVWGGENNDPPVFGRVFISAVTPEGRLLTTEQKNGVTNSISTYKIATVQVEYVDPEYIEVALTANVYYDQTLTNKTPAELVSDIASAYALYNTTQLAKFDSIIRNSALIRTAENANSSIVNVIPKLSLRYNLNAIFNQRTNYKINLKNPILNRIGSVQSSAFYCSESSFVCYIDDDNDGNLILFSIESGVRKDIRIVGSINHEEGSFTLNSLTISSVIGNNVTFTIVPTSPDVVSFNNKIVRLDLNNLTINVIADGNLNGQLKNTYTFTQI